MAVALRTRERDVEEDERPAPKKPGGGDTVNVGGMDHLVEGREPEEEVEIEIEQPASRQVRTVEREPEHEEEDARLAYEEDEQDGLQERGATSRRARRNRARREAIAARDQDIAKLHTELNGLKTFVGSLTQGHMGLTMNNIEGQIGTTRQQLAMADEAIAKAVTAGDGVEFARVQKFRDEAAARLFQLDGAKSRLLADAQRQQQPGGQQQQRQPNNGGAAAAVHPNALKFSEIFMERHPWFDPNGGDEDSKIVAAIDDAVAQEGYNPGTKMYWLEVERRVRARGIGPAEIEVDGDDDMPQRREQRQPAERRQAMPPRNGARGQSQGAGKSVHLDPQAVEYLDSEGLLEPNLSDDQKARKKRLIAAWDAGKKKAAAGGFARS